MFETLRLWKFREALRRKGNAEAAYTAVLELGRMGHARALDLLITALERYDGVARSAARELGRLGEVRAIPVLVKLLGDPRVSQSALDALVSMGPRAVEPLIQAVNHPQPEVRRLAAQALGDLADKRAGPALIRALEADDDCSVRTAAATALGQLKDPRSVWALVATLKLRDETSAENQVALDELRRAAQWALRKIGDPLASKPAPAVEPETTNPEALLTPAQLEMHPALVPDPALLTHGELVAVLKELVTASEEVAWAKLEQREPLLALHFRDYEQRRRTAETAGGELQRRGGVALMREVWERDLGSFETIDNWWRAIPEWEAAVQGERVGVMQ